MALRSAPAHSSAEGREVRMTQIALLLFFFVCLGLFGARFKGRIHLFLVFGVALIIAYELYHLHRM